MLEIVRNEDNAMLYSNSDTYVNLLVILNAAVM